MYPLTYNFPALATMSENINPSLSGPDGKRKRSSLDTGDGQRMPRSPPMANTNGNMHNPNNGNIHGANYLYVPVSDPSAHLVVVGYDTHGLNNGAELSIDQQLVQHIGGQNGVSDENAMTAKAALAAHPQSKYSVPEAAFDNNTLAHNMNGFGDEVAQVAMTNVHGHNSTAAAVYAAREAQSMNQMKPPVGSPEWHTQRKNNHKEGEERSVITFRSTSDMCLVERRRRETINEGINELAKLVPGTEKAKGSILQRAVQHILKLQDDNKGLVDRWDTTQMTTNQAIAEISAQNEKLKAEVNRRGVLAMKWLQRCREAGLDFADYDDDKDLSQLEVVDVQM